MSLKSYHTWVAVFTGVAMIWVVPAALLLAFGHRAETPGVAPLASVESSGSPCVMFCESAPLAAPSTTPPTTGSTQGCRFLCDEPPLPTPGELCQLFCELGRR